MNEKEFLELAMQNPELALQAAELARKQLAAKDKRARHHSHPGGNGSSHHPGGRDSPNGEQQQRPEKDEGPSRQRWKAPELEAPVTGDHPGSVIPPLAPVPLLLCLP